MPNIQFCEPAYDVTPFVAEFTNTLSSLLICVPSLVLWNTCDSVFFRSFLISTFIVGIGSAAFHGTQTLWGELLDEIPMLLIFLPLLGGFEGASPSLRGKKGNNTLKIILSLIVVFCGLYLLTHHWFFFHLSFSTGVLSTMILSMGFDLPSFSQYIWKGITPAQLKLVSSFLSFAIGFAFWCSERILCDAANPYPTAYFHSLWHLMVTVSIFFTSMGFADLRNEVHTMRENSETKPEEVPGISRMLSGRQISGLLQANYESKEAPVSPVSTCASDSFTPRFVEQTKKKVM